jgi:uncharacterized membrane protein required for colicin V production
LSLLFRFDSLRDYILILIFLVISVIVISLFLFVIAAALIFGERGALDSLGGGLTVG